MIAPMTTQSSIRSFSRCGVLKDTDAAAIPVGQFAAYAASSCYTPSQQVRYVREAITDVVDRIKFAEGKNKKGKQVRPAKPEFLPALLRDFDSMPDYYLDALTSN